MIHSNHKMQGPPGSPPGMSNGMPPPMMGAPPEQDIEQKLRAAYQKLKMIAQQMGVDLEGMDQGGPPMSPPPVPGGY